MLLEIGKLYQIKQYYWLLYPSKEKADTATCLRGVHAYEADGAEDGKNAATYYSEHWSKQLNCNVSYISPETILFLVEVDDWYAKVVSTEGVGWITVCYGNEEYFQEVKEQPYA